MISQIADVKADIKLLEEEKTQFQKDKEVAEKCAEKVETELKKTGRQKRISATGDG